MYIKDWEVANFLYEEHMKTTTQEALSEVTNTGRKLENLIRAAMEYVESVQNGARNNIVPSIDELMFCGSVHGIVYAGTVILQKKILDQTPVSFTVKV